MRPTRRWRPVLRYGINHIDTAASYGEAELRLGPWMERHRERFFLATKTGERTYEAARDQIRRSLERLRVPQVDLIQLHNLAQPEEWDVAMGPDGALRACVEAREAGLVRFIGVTGHGTGIARMHRRSLERFDFDSVLLPFNYPMMQNPQYAADFEALLALCQERNVAVQTIKAITRAPWEERPHTRRHLVRALAASRGTSTWRCTGCWGARGSSSTPSGTSTSCPGCWTPGRASAQAPPDEALARLVAQREMAPLFV